MFIFHFTSTVLVNEIEKKLEKIAPPIALSNHNTSIIRLLNKMVLRFICLKCYTQDITDIWRSVHSPSTPKISVNDILSQTCQSYHNYHTFCAA